MNKLLKLAMFMALAIISFAACKKDEETKKTDPFIAQLMDNKWVLDEIRTQFTTGNAIADILLNKTFNEALAANRGELKADSVTIDLSVEGKCTISSKGDGSDTYNVKIKSQTKEVVLSNNEGENTTMKVDIVNNKLNLIVNKETLAELLDDLDDEDKENFKSITGGTATLYFIKK